MMFLRGFAIMSKSPLMARKEDCHGLFHSIPEPDAP